MSSSWPFKRAWDAVGAIAEYIYTWEPGNIHSEAEAESSLNEHLKKALPGVPVRRQVPYDRVRADIVVDNCVAIEIKFNLLKTADFQRLVGQLEQYREWDKKFLLVLVGDVNLDLVGRVRKRMSKDWDDGDAQLVVKPLDTD